jgi:hypothetical protein
MKQIALRAKERDISTFFWFDIIGHQRKNRLYEESDTVNLRNEQLFNHTLEA